MFCTWGQTEEGPYRPLVDLLQLSERRGEHQSADGITETSSPMRVQLAAFIALGDVHARQIADAGDLHEIRGLDEGGAVDTAIGDETRAVTILHTPRDFDLLGVTDV